MTTAYEDNAFRSQYEQLMDATQQQLHAPLKQHIVEEQKEQETVNTSMARPHLAPHLAFTLSSPTSASLPSPLSSTHSVLSQSAPNALSSVSCCSSSSLLPHLSSLASSFASHQQHVNGTLLALQAAVAEERREREAEAKRGKREEVIFRRRLQDRLDEVRDESNDKLHQLHEQAAAHRPPPTATPQTNTSVQPPQSTVSPAAYDSLSRELDSLRQQLHALRSDLATLAARTSQPQPPAADVSLLVQRVEKLEALTALHTATIQQQSDHYTTYRTQEAREKADRRREVEDRRRRDREESEERDRAMRSGFEAELRRLVERLDKRDVLDNNHEVEQDRDRQRQEQNRNEQPTSAAAADDRRKQLERDEEQRRTVAEERERQKRLQAEAKAEAELAALRREQEEIDRQQERARQEKLRQQQEAERQRLETERQKRELERKTEQERLHAEEQSRQRINEEAEQHRREAEQKLAEDQKRQAEQHHVLAPHPATSSADAAVPSATSVPYNVFVRLWNLPLSPAGTNNPIAALFLPSAAAASAPASATSSDGWQYCSQTEWMKDDRHPVFEQALLWDYDSTVQSVKVSVYDVVDENVRDEDRLGSAVIPAHLLLAASSTASGVVRPSSSPVPPADAPVNGLTFRLVHEDEAKQARLGDVILMVECEADQPATPQPPQPAAASTMLLVRLATIALPSRANGALPSPIAAAFFESADGEMVYVDQTEWLKRTSGAEFAQSMELPVGDDEVQRRVRLSVYDVDSEEVRDEDRLGHVQLTIGELRSLATAGSSREMELSHEEGGKEGRLRESGSRVRVTVEVLAEEELEFEVEERKAGRRAAPPAHAGGEKDDEADAEKETEEDEESSEEEVEREEDEAEEVEVEVEDGQQTDDDDDVELVVEAHHERTNSTTVQQADSVNADEETESAEVAGSAGSTQHQQSEEQKEGGSGQEVNREAANEAAQEVEEVYSDFAESSSEDEEQDQDEDEEEPQLHRDDQPDTHPSGGDGHKLPLMPQLASELSDEDVEQSPSITTTQQQHHSEQPNKAVDGQQQQHNDSAVHRKADESGSETGSEIEEDINMEFAADDDDSHFDLL